MRRYATLKRVSAKTVVKRAHQLQWRGHVMARAGDRCEVGYPEMIAAATIFTHMRCPKRAVDVHHVVKRSQGGEDHPDNLVAICREHHDRTDFPYSRGRLVITPLGHEQFRFEIRMSKR